MAYLLLLRSFREKRCHVEHDISTLELREHAFLSCLVIYWSSGGAYTQCPAQQHSLSIPSTRSQFQAT